MPALPVSSDFNDVDATEGEFKAATTALLAYLSGLLGADGLPATAQAALGAALSGHSTRSAAFTASTADRGRVIDASGTWTLTLPAAATAGAGFSFVLRVTSGTITVAAAAAETIEGVASVVTGAGRTAILFCTGAAWLTFALPGDLAGRVRVADGTAALPGLLFALDPDTGFSRPAANQIGTSVGGVLATLLSGTALSIDVPVTGLAVQASAYENAPTKLMKAGAFGLGADYPGQIADLDLLTSQIGFYFYNMASGTTGTTPGFSPGGLFLGSSIGSGVRSPLQIAVARAGDQMAFRAAMASAWSPWRRLYHTGNVLGAVSQDAGVPTGALIETGSNANGSFERFANGTLNCTQTMAASSGGAATWTFPATFIAAPVVTGTAQATVLSCVVRVAAPTTTAATFSARDSANARRADTCHLRASGRWF